MKVIIAGSRDVTDLNVVKWAIEASGFEITEVVCGCARGVDVLGEMWGDENGIHVQYFPANWNAYGDSAGPIRNTQMANYADALIAIPGPKSRGTWDMVNKAKAKGLKVYVHDELIKVKQWPATPAPSQT